MKFAADTFRSFQNIRISITLIKCISREACLLSLFCLSPCLFKAHTSIPNVLKWPTHCLYEFRVGCQVYVNLRLAYVSPVYGCIRSALLKGTRKIPGSSHLSPRRLTSSSSKISSVAFKPVSLDLAPWVTIRFMVSLIFVRSLRRTTQCLCVRALLTMKKSVVGIEPWGWEVKTGGVTNFKRCEDTVEDE